MLCAMKTVTMQDQDVIKRLPLGWRDLFNNFCNQSSPDSADLWYMDAMQSSYGHRPGWHALLVSLQIQDPFIRKNELVFKPRFLHLSEGLQEMFLTFLVKESYIIPDKDLVGFVQTINEFQNMERTAARSGHTACLLQQIVVYNQKTMDATKAEECLRESQPGVEQEDHNQSEENIDIIVIDEEEVAEPAAKRQRLDLSERMKSENETKEVEMKDYHTHENQETSVAMDFDGSKRINDITEKLKDIWQGDADSGFLEALSEVSRLSLHEIEWFCKRIDFPAMTDDSTEVVCKHLCHLADSLSYTSGVCILQYVILYKVLQLTQTPSRKLSGAINLAAESFPKQLVDSVIVPCVSQEEISSFQGELICRIIKEKLLSSSKTYLAQKLVLKDFVTDESKFAVLQTLLESDMDSNLMSNLLNSFSQVSEKFAKSLKFGKLLLALVNKHGQKLTGDDKIRFSSIVDNHGTFLKKTVKNVLNKLK